MKTVALVPIKLNSERLPLKNIKPFTNGNPLITYILKTLKKVKEIDEIYVYCSSPDIKKFLPDNVIFYQRDKYYDLSSTPFNEVLTSFAELVCADTYVLTHATAPFIKAESISLGIKKVNEEGYEAAFSVLPMQEFLWKDNMPFNYSLENIPRTQDLEILYVETCGLYVYKSSLIKEKHKRIGKNNYLIPVSKIEACDINTEEDFLVADALFNFING